ncbi:predicted protein [Lichtheimia corymbifera JMRC:FSU:9682]|uniref:Uncharacterized protein n=1 Tax=Lichtheimia corymbifera JMRC:FSU:9682 TaxID=1263082 RepID=A0A068RXF5_9FUNG|nr:predicted protein [Lichtheimia corymbifera JMRC:FSU:9682]
MEDLFWVNLCQPISLTATHHECNSIVTESTLRIRQCLTQLTSLLEERTLALLKCAQFDMALRDTTAIQKLDPTLALGYLLKGKVYAYRGQQQQAIKIYDQGLAIAPVMNDQKQQCQQQLLKAKANAETMQQKRIDFITQLPLDIVSTSIVPLLMDDETWSIKRPCPYFQVSKRWRERFGRDGRLCYEVDGSEPYPAYLVSLCDCVHSMVIHNYNPDGDGFRQLGQLSALQRLSIAGISSENGSSFLSSLRKIGASLQDMEISLTPGTMLNVRDIMERCPHLSRLVTYRVASADLLSALHPYPHLMQPIPSLVTLELCALRKPVTHQQALSLLQHYPSLQSLTLYPCHDSNFLPMVHQHCPSLQNVVIGTQKSMHVPPQPLQHTNNQRGGLRSLHIEDEFAQYYNIEDIRQCMMTHSATLESATLKVGTLRDDPDPPAAVQFPQLRQLRCPLRRGIDPALFGWWIPYHAPALEHVDLNINTLDRSSRLFEALCNMPQIRSLVLNTAFGDMQLLVQLIEAVGRHGLLEELVLSTELVSMVYDAMKHAIGKMTHLKRLSLGKLERLASRELSNDTIIHVATHCHNLRELDIETCWKHADTGLLVLSILDHLEIIALPARNLSSAGIMALAKFPRLRHLTLYGTEQRQLQHPLDQLKQTQPQLKISWRDY